MTPRQKAAMRQALEALCDIIPANANRDEVNRIQGAAINALREELAEVKQEPQPYGWVRMNASFNSGVFHLGAECPPGWIAAAKPVWDKQSPAKQMLTDQQIDAIAPALDPVSEDFQAEWVLWKERERMRKELRAL